MRAYIILLSLSLFFLKQTTAQASFSFEQEKKSQTSTVTVNVHSNSETIWELITSSENIPKWNSTIISLAGEIEVGEKIALTSQMDPDKTFKLKVIEMVPNESMVWKGSGGLRTFSIKKATSGVTFTMSETIGGFMYPMYAKHLPDFESNFVQFANDLKKAAEAKHHAH